MPLDVPPITYEEKQGLPNQRLIILLTLAVIILIGVSIYLFPKINLIFPIKEDKQITKELAQTKPITTEPTANLMPSASPSPTPRPLPREPQIYTFSHGQDVQGPRPIKASINTLLPTQGQKQIFEISFAHSEPILSHNLTLVTDNKELTLELKLIEGNAQTGTWQAQWLMQDTYNTHYELRYKFQDSTSTHEGALLYR